MLLSYFANWARERIDIKYPDVTLGGWGMKLHFFILPYLNEGGYLMQFGIFFILTSQYGSQSSRSECRWHKLDLSRVRITPLDWWRTDVPMLY